MKTDEHKSKRYVRKIAIGFVVSALVYIVSYCFNSFFGGYWLKPEMDGRDRYSFGLAIPTAIMWQLLFGHEAIGHWDYVGAFYTPLVRLDRKFIHPTIYIFDDDGFERASRLSVSKVHPRWRDFFATKVTVVASRDEGGQVIRCTFHLTGSDLSRAITGIQMPRELVQTLEATPPEGFSEKPVEDHHKSLNEKYVFWTGKLLIPKDQDVILLIPAMQAKAGTGKIRFDFERIDKLSDDSRDSCSVELQQAP